MGVRRGTGQVSLPIHLANTMLWLPRRLSRAAHPSDYKKHTGRNDLPSEAERKKKEKKIWHILHFACYLVTFVIQGKYNVQLRKRGRVGPVLHWRYEEKNFF